MKRFKTLLVSVAVLVTMAVGVSPAAAVTDGWVDSNNAYPMVGLMVALNDAGEPMWRCSGTPYTHPDFNPDAFYLADVGIVVLDEPVYLDAYGYLPEVNELDVWETRRGRQDIWLTAVGYGLQKSYPDAASWKNEALRIRMIAQPRLIQINQGIVGDLSLLLSNNANTGGTCFGDSGGPNFVRDSFKIAGVTSFGLNGNCAGTGGVFRVDRAGAQEFINQFL
jgi:hypothetical protein